MTGGRHFQLRPKRGKLLADVGVAEMVCCWGLCAPKRCASYPLHRTGIIRAHKRNGDNSDRIPQHKAEGTMMRQGGRYCDSAGRQQDGRHDSPINAKETV